MFFTQDLLWFCQKHVARAIFFEGILRLSRKDRNSRRARRFGPQDWWYHVDCFIRKRNELGFFTSMEPEKYQFHCCYLAKKNLWVVCVAICLRVGLHFRIPGFDALTSDDQQQLADTIRNHVPGSDSDDETL